MTSTSVDLCTIPAGTSPDGQYNFENPKTLAPASHSVGVIFATISTSLTIGRVFINRKKLSAVDYVLLAACVINVTFTGVVLAQYKFHRHIWDVPVCWFTPTYFRMLYIQTTLIAPVFLTSKAAIFLLYRQLFAVHKRMNVAIYIGILINFILYLPSIPLSAIFDAPRIGGSWDSMVTSPPKMVKVWGIFQSSITILLDLYIFFLPIPIIIQLNMPLGRRLQLVGIFATALMGVVAGVLSLAYRIQLLHTRDTLWLAAKVLICALVEANVAIIVCCLPSFAHLLHTGGSAVFKSLRSRLLGVVGGRRRASSSNPAGHELKEERPKVATFGSGHPHRRRNYYELTDTFLLRSQDTAVDDGPNTTASLPDGIVRPIGDHPDFRLDSTEHLA